MHTLKALVKGTLSRPMLAHLQALDHYWHGEPEIRLIPQLAADGRDAIDAGANIGTYTYFLRKYARRVYAFEPNPQLAQGLRELFPDVVVRNLALSDTAGHAVLRIPVRPDGTELHELASIAQAFDGRTRDCPIRSVTIDSENFDNIGFLKVDVEQHERQVLQGALDTIQRCRPAIMTEISPLKYEQALPDVFAFLTRHAYAGWFRFGGKWLPLAAYRGEVHCNRAHYGSKKQFIGGNILFFPDENRLSRTGPAA